MGWDWRDMTRTARGRLNQALMELREIEATPEQVTSAARAYRAMYENATLTPQALVGNWPDLMKWLRGARTAYGYDPSDSMQRAIEISGGSEWDQPGELPEEALTADEIKQRVHEAAEGLRIEAD